jgi:hypothetical protein
MSRVLKAISIYDERTLDAWENAAGIVREDVDEDLTNGEVLRELAVAYTGYDPGAEAQEVEA